LVESDWYKRRWPGTKINYSLEASANNYSTTAGGTRKAFTVAGAVVGAHYDIQVVDDPIKPYEVTGSLAVSDRVLDRVWSWWTETMSTRKLPGKKRGRIVIMQRLCEGDLAGRCKDAGYEYLCLPMRYDSARKCVTKIFTDPREEEGELLCPDRFPEEEVRKTERDLGTRGAQAQLQLDPKARSGGTFDEKHAVFYDKLPYLIKQVQSWDCTFSETGDSYVVGQVWGQADPANFYLIDEIREKLSFTNTLKAVKRLSVLYPKSRSKYIEKKANGAAVIDALKKEVVGLIPVEPEGGKEARANAMSSLWEGGNIHLPADKPWIKDWVAEVTGFPGARDKDRVDAMTQAINKLYRSAQSSLKKAMENIR
jgi:predicted phage terminase large subunit-like protein